MSWNSHAFSDHLLLILVVQLSVSFPWKNKEPAEASSEAPLQLMAAVQGTVVLLLWVACLWLADASFFFTRLPGPISLAQPHASWMAALLTELKAYSFANSGIPLPLRQQLLPRPILALLLLNLLTDLKHLYLNYLLSLFLSICFQSLLSNTL